MKQMLQEKEMYDPIFAKSFSRYERKRFGFFALILCFILALSVCSTFKPHLHPFSLIGDAIKLQLSMDSAEDAIIALNKTNGNPELTDDDTAAGDLEGNIATVSVNTTQQTGLNHKADSSTESPQNDVEVNPDKVNVISTPHIGSSSLETKTKQALKPLCRILESHADYCEIEGDVRIEPNSSTVFLVSPRSTIPESTVTSWNIQPYPRRGIDYVKNWTVKIVSEDENVTRIPQCTQNHSSPALLLSLGGYSGNLFHAFADLLHPLYLTSFQFHKDVHLLASDYKPWWASKYQTLLNGLTKHAVIDINRDKNNVRCYKKMIVGLRFYKELTTHPLSNSPTMHQFRLFLRETYSLERTNAVKYTKGRGKTRPSPRLMIISRRRTRIITNEDEVSSIAKKMGFEIVIAEADVSTNLTRFAQIVNSCDVLMGVHGAGLTNMIFLPDNAVLIQVVPLGGIDVFAKLDFGDPASGMNVKYVSYKIKMKESSLSRTYRRDDPVITDPLSFHRRGWLLLRSIYLDNQNVTIDPQRFRGTLARAMKLLRR